MTKINYVCGFLFHGDWVLLVKKKKPVWQAGLLNGIDGKVEKFETVGECMRREFLEETGRDVVDFKLFATESGRDYKVYFYKSHLPSDEEWRAKYTNDVGEKLTWIHPQRFDLHHAVVGNLNWLIPLALDPRRMDVVTVIARDDISGRPTW